MGKIIVLLLLFFSALAFWFAFHSTALFSSEEIEMDSETKVFLRAFNKVSSGEVDIEAMRKVVFPSSSVPVRDTQDISIQGPSGPIPCRVYIPDQQFPLTVPNLAKLQSANPLDCDEFIAKAMDEEQYEGDAAVTMPERDSQRKLPIPDGEKLFPVYIAFGGGGWVAGNLESNDAICREICHRSGFLVLSVEYHKAPEFPFPKPLEDCYAALLWAAGNIQEFGGDPARLCIGGDSAGGNLAAAAALLARDRGGPLLHAQVLLYPVTNFDFETLSYYENSEGYLLTREAMKVFWGHYLGGEKGENRYASPLQAHLEGLPPTLIITANFDPLRDEGLAYAHQLKKSGVPVTVLQYPTIHGFISFSRQISLGEKALEEIALFLNSGFSG